MEPLHIFKHVTIELSETKMPKGTYTQLHAGGHTIEIKHKLSGEVVVCVNDKSIVKTFNEEY